MRFGRRDVLRLGLSSPLLRPLRALAETSTTRPLVLGPYLCDPRPDAMGVFVQGEPHARLTVIATPTGRGRSSVAELRLDAYGIGRADLLGLRPEADYRYEVRATTGALAAARFRTPPRAQQRRVRLAFGADIHHGWKPYSVFDRVREARPLALFCLGDQVYADADPPELPATEEAYRSLYPANWDDPSLARCWAEIPTLLAWDDHEIWNDYDHSFAPERFAPASAAYDAYQGIRNPCGVRGDVRWYTGQIGPCAYFVLDLRTFRQGNDAPDVDGKSILGAPQRAALLRFLEHVEAPVKLVLSPSSLHDFTTTGHDAWGDGFRSERDFLFRAMGDPRVGNVVIVSGDMHWPAVVRHELSPSRVVYELQCTPIAAFPREPTVSTDPSILWHGDGACGFGQLDIDATGPVPEVRFAWIDASGTRLFELEVPTD